MKLVRAVRTATLAVVLTGCSATGTGVGSGPSSAPSAVADTEADSAVVAACTVLVRAYQSWAATSESSWDDPISAAELRDGGEAFLGELDDVSELPTGELAGALSTYVEELELLLTGYEHGERPNTIDVELAAAVVTEQTQTLAEEACP
jgi:hypothetical protein